MEVQRASLSAIRGKLAELVATHPVRLVKPCVVGTVAVTVERVGGRVGPRRRTAERESLWDVLAELVHLRDVFPDPNLTVEICPVVIEQIRRPDARYRRRRKGYRILDVRLLEHERGVELAGAADLAALLPADLPPRFTTADLAVATGTSRAVAQKCAYACRHAGAIDVVERRRGGVIYCRTGSAARAA